MTLLQQLRPNGNLALDHHILFLALPPQIQFLCLPYEEIFVLGLFCLTLYTGRKQSVVVSIHMLQGHRV